MSDSVNANLTQDRGVALLHSHFCRIFFYNLISAPGRVVNFKITPQGNYTQMIVSWSIPLLRERNGIIKEYVIKYNGVSSVLEIFFLTSYNRVCQF